eukprot:gene12807-biopygen7333
MVQIRTDLSMSANQTVPGPRPQPRHLRRILQSAFWWLACRLLHRRPALPSLARTQAAARSRARPGGACSVRGLGPHGEGRAICPRDFTRAAGAHVARSAPRLAGAPQRGVAAAARQRQPALGDLSEHSRIAAVEKWNTAKNSQTLEMGLARLRRLSHFLSFPGLGRALGDPAESNSRNRKVNAGASPDSPAASQPTNAADESPFACSVLRLSPESPRTAARLIADPLHGHMKSAAPLGFAHLARGQHFPLKRRDLLSANATPGWGEARLNINIK